MLTPCRYRGAPNAEGRFPCTSPFLVCGSVGITAEHCQRCPVPDKVPSEPLPPIITRPPPTAAEMLASFLRAIKHELAWRAKGGRGPTPEEKAVRRQLCDTCEQRDPVEDRCKACGCYLEAQLLHIPPIPIGKLDMSSQRCPIRKWMTVAGAPEAGCR